MVAEFPGLDHVRDEEDDTKEDADAAHNNVGDAQEGVAPAHYCARRDDKRLGALELVDGEDLRQKLAIKGGLRRAGSTHSFQF